MIESKRGSDLRKWVFAALFMALGLVLPFLTAQVQQIGNMLLPMHLPVMLCGLICGWRHGMLVGFILPPFRSLLFGMPPLYPNSVWMAFELATYGFVIGFLYARSRKQSTPRLYACLIAAMLAGRVVWGTVKAMLLGVGGEKIAIQAFIAEGFLNAIPGIILQLILIPLIMAIYQKMHLQITQRGD